MSSGMCETFFMSDHEAKPGRSRKGGKPRAEPARRKSRGFLRAATLTPDALRSAGAKRGFAELRLLTEWRAVAGEALASICRPVKVSYSRRDAPGLGATLIVTAPGARAPEVEMSAPRIIERVNAFYGYRAVSRIRIDQSRDPSAPLRRSAPLTGQTAGFAEDAPGWSGPPPGVAGGAAEPIADEVAPVAGVADERLARALARLGASVVAHAKASRANAEPATEAPENTGAPRTTTMNKTPDNKPWSLE